MNNLLKDLLAMRAEHGLRDSQLPHIEVEHLEADEPDNVEHITEARRGGDMSELIEKWCDQNQAYSWEGSRGIRNFTKLVGVLGYRSLDDFLSDNSGAMEAMVEWIGGTRMPEWTDKMKDEVGGDEDDEG